VVGNETTLRAEMSVDDLIKIIQRVKRSSPVPVTTGEIWTVWIDHPELASAVDFIAAHILPYWKALTLPTRSTTPLNFTTSSAVSTPASGS